MASDNEIPTDTVMAYLYMPKDMPLVDCLRLLLQRERLLPSDGGKQILETLRENGVTNYGQLLEYVQENSIAYLPGISEELRKLYQLRDYIEQKGIVLPSEIKVDDNVPSYTEAIYTGIIRAELENKLVLERKYHEAQEEITRLKQEQPAKQLDKATIDGREIAKSM